jgi:hypothetical protein
LGWAHVHINGLSDGRRLMPDDDRDLCEICWSLLQRYEAIRLPRTARVQATSMPNKARFHLEDGSEQEERDHLMTTGSTDWSNSAIGWIYGHDASKLEAPA